MTLSLSGRTLRLLALALLVLLSACGPKAPSVTYEPKAKVEKSKALDDLRDLPQDATAYMEKSKAATPVLAQDAARMRADIFLERLFRPWSGGNAAYARKAALRSLQAYSRNPGYDDLGLPRTKYWAEAIVANAGMRPFANMARPAITVANTNLRAIPTMDHRFGPPNKPGQGYPFDMLQVSALWVGTPVLVDHVSRDGAWALVETAIAPGWVRTADLGFADEAFMAQYRSRPFAGIVAENVPLGAEPGNTVLAGVGAVLPMEDAGSASLRLLAPVTGGGPLGRADTRSVTVAKDQAVPLPLPATPANIARLANQMMGQTYGWGGLDGKRDCSAATRDVLAPCGIWLPRNSAAQAKAGSYIPLSGMSPEEKEQVILKSGVPYATLIWLPGHILLYIGQYKGLPVAFHNVWGMRTLDKDGNEGRRVVGKAVITTLRLGEIYPDVGPERTMLSRVRGLTIMTPSGNGGGLEPEGDSLEENQ